MEEVAFEVANLRAQLWVLNCIVASASVSLIAHDGMFQLGEMNANLMGPSGF